MPRIAYRGIQAPSSSLRQQSQATSHFGLSPTHTSSSRPPMSDIIRFSSHQYLRQRIVLCILSGRSIRVDKIRTEDVQIGLRDYEINLLRLVEKVTNGTTIDISVTGESPACLANARYLICSPPRRPPGRLVHPLLPSRPRHWLLSRADRPPCTILQESSRYHPPWHHWICTERPNGEASWKIRLSRSMPFAQSPYPISISLASTALTSR